LRIVAYLLKSDERINQLLEEVYNMFPILNERRNQVAETTVIQTGNPILSGDGDCKDLCNSDLVKKAYLGYKYVLQ